MRSCRITRLMSEQGGNGEPSCGRTNFPLFYTSFKQDLYRLKYTCPFYAWIDHPGVEE